MKKRAGVKRVEAWAGVWNRGGISLHFTERDAYEHLDGRGDAVRLVEANPAAERELRALRRVARAALRWFDAGYCGDGIETTHLVNLLASLKRSTPGKRKGDDRHTSLGRRAHRVGRSEGSTTARSLPLPVTAEAKRGLPAGT